MRFQLAQVNVARMLYPLDDPRMSDFVARIAEINALAESSPGFVWRYRDDSPGAVYTRPLPDPNVLFNLSVWRDIEVLREFVYNSGHIELLRAKASWFERPTRPSLAMWWVPAGYEPSPSEAVAKLAELERDGESASVFSFRKPFQAAAASI